MKQVPKKINIDDFVYLMKKKLRKEKDPVKKQMYQEFIKEFE